MRGGGMRDGTRQNNFLLCLVKSLKQTWTKSIPTVSPCLRSWSVTDTNEKAGRLLWRDAYRTGRGIHEYNRLPDLLPSRFQLPISPLLYHDASSLLTSKECRKCMKNTYFDAKKLYDKWLIHTVDVNVGTKYHGRCVGNSPKFMPLDNSLNNDIQMRYRYRCAVTAHQPNDIPRKHTLATPKRITDGLKKLGRSCRSTKYQTRSLRCL